MTLHNFFLSKEICKSIIEYTITLEQGEPTSGDRGGLSPFISKTQGGIKESSAVKDMSLFNDPREYHILKGYQCHKESGYTNYASEELTALLPDSLFSYFFLDRKDCLVDVKKSSPGKIHIPHKDYYINYKYNLVDVNGSLEFTAKQEKELNDKKVVRLWITLTEPRFGHILIVEDKTYYWLEQGSVVTWEAHELHTAANLGFEDRYIMTITGSQNVVRD